MQISDVIEVHFKHYNDGIITDSWVPAIVEVVKSGKIGVRPLVQKTFPTGDERRWLPLSGHQEMWR